MRKDVAVVDEPTDNRRIREWDYNLHFASDGHVDDVAAVVDGLTDAVDLRELERPLMDNAEVPVISAA